MVNIIRFGLALLGGMLSAFGVANAQSTRCNFTLQGHVGLVDPSSASASVYLPKTKTGLRTDSAGNFTLTGLCPGLLELVITCEGYKKIDTTIKFTQDRQSLRLFLTGAADQLTSVTVAGGLLHKDQISTAVKTTLSGQALDETRGASLGESLKSIAGVNSLQTGPSVSKPIIHGVYSNRILILNNGVRQEGQNWGNDHAPEIDPFIATKVTVIKGAASIRYGSDAIGGVVLLDPKDMRKDAGMDGEVNVVAISNGRVGVASGMMEGAAGSKLEGLSWRLQGTLKKAGNARAAGYYLGNTGFHENDYSATVEYNKAHYGASLYYSRFNTTGSALPPPRK